MPVNVSNKRLRRAKNLTNYGAPYGGFGFGVPVRTGTSVWSMRLYPKMKQSCCVDKSIKSYSYKKCCNDPKLRAEITTVVSDSTTSNASTIDMNNVPNLFASNSNHVVLANHKWVDQGGELSSTFEVAVTGDETSAILNAQNNINSGTMIDGNQADGYAKFHYDVANKKIVYFSHATSTAATGFITYSKTS